MSEADRAAQAYMAGKGLAEMPTAPADEVGGSTEGGGSKGTGNGVFMPMDIVKQIANGYKQYGWALKLARVKLPKEIDYALRAIADGDMTGAAKLQRMSGQQPQQMAQQPQMTQDPEQQEEEPLEVGKTVVTRKMAQKMWEMHERGMGLRPIADYFKARGSPLSYQTVANSINDFEADEDERGNNRMGSVLRALGLIGGMAGVTVLVVFVLHFIGI